MMSVVLVGALEHEAEADDEHHSKSREQMALFELQGLLLVCGLREGTESSVWRFLLPNEGFMRPTLYHAFLGMPKIRKCGYETRREPRLAAVLEEAVTIPLQVFFEFGGACPTTPKLLNLHANGADRIEDKEDEESTSREDMTVCEAPKDEQERNGTRANCNEGASHGLTLPHLVIGEGGEIRGRGPICERAGTFTEGMSTQPF